MISYRHIFSFFLLIVFNLSAIAQLRIWSDGIETDIQSRAYTFRFEEHALFTDAALLSALNRNWQPICDTRLRISDPNRTFWLKLPLLANGGAIPQLLNIDNPHLNQIKLWIKERQGNIRSFPITGDNLPFSSRMLPEPTFIFPLPQDVAPGDTIIIAADKRASKLELPIHFSSRAYHITTQQRRMFGYGVFFGFMLLLLMMNAWLLATTRARVYLWYAVYLLAILAYLSSDTGLLYQYIFPGRPGWNDLMRPFLFGASLFPLLLFFNELLDIRNTSPAILRFNRILLTVYMLVYAIALITSSSGNLGIQAVWLKLAAVLVPVFYFIILGETFYFLKRRIRFAFFMLYSFGSYTILVTIFLLAQRDMIVQNTFTLKAHYIALYLDAAVVASSLFWRFRHLSEEAGRLQGALLRQQARIFSETAEWQKTEMRRFSSLLHDSIGAHLGLLRFRADQMSLTEQSRRDLSQRIGGLADEVRRMSHRFSPLVLQEKGLNEALAEEVRFLHGETGIIFQYEWLGDDSRLPHSYEIIIYRMVQELLQNVFKHAAATEVILQVISDGRQLSVYVEDNGRGVAGQEAPSFGIGLRSIRELTDFLGGQCHVRTAPGEGFSVSIELNIHDYADHNRGHRG